MDKNTSTLKLYSSVEAMQIDWIWYPYIPSGKITVLQGDPGNGKSTMIINLIAVLSRGKAFPGGTLPSQPLNIIYQCSEDSIADTIKPRLVAAGADCTKVAFIKEDNDVLTLDDEKIRQAIIEFNAKLVVIDPVQAYLGDADLSNANSIRKVMRRLGIWAETYGCAIVLVGHLNKKEGSKDLYRCLGSIDIMAASRSVLQIDCYSEDSQIRVVHQIKNSLAERGKDCYFVINSEGALRWEQEVGDRKAQSGSEGDADVEYCEKTKQEDAASLMREMLVEKPHTASEILDQCKKCGFSRNTVYLAKKILGIKSEKRNKKWYWMLPSGGQLDEQI